MLGKSRSAVPTESRVIGCPTASSGVYPATEVSAALIERILPRVSVITTAIGSCWRAATSRSVSGERSDILPAVLGEAISTERHITYIGQKEPRLQSFC